MAANVQLGTDQQFIDAWKSTGGRASEVAKLLGYTTTSKVYNRRAKIEKRLNVVLSSAGDSNHKGRGDAGATPYDYNPRLRIDGFTGAAVVFSDCHWWPGISETVAYKALLEVIKEIKPKLIVANGDILDGAQISRFGPIGWVKTPDVKAELDEVGARMTAIRRAAPNAHHIRTIGNHDLRYDSTLASRAAQFTGIKGFRLADHLCEWKETMSLWVNDGVVIKHRWHNGINAGRNNTLKAGKTMVTGHDHILQITPYLDYNGLRWAVQDGTLSDPGGPQFAYGEDNPSQANSGFVVLPFLKDGRMIDPEVCRVIDSEAWFRGQKVASMTAAQIRLRKWAKMTAAQKLADVEREDRRRKTVA